MRRNQVEGFADAGQHSQRQNIDLHDPERVDVVLVPFDEGAVCHRRRPDRDDGVEPVLCQHEPTDMLRQVTRKTEQLIGMADHLRQCISFPVCGHNNCMLDCLVRIRSRMVRN